MAIPWDEPLPTPLQTKWQQLLREVLLMAPIIVPRSVRPPAAVGPPEMIVYTDGSVLAYAALIYLRFEVEERLPGPWHSGLDRRKGWRAHLLTSKTRVTPPAGLTAPRSEINSLILGARLATLALSSLSEKPSRLTIIGDSQCTISTVESNSASLAAYFANRVSEFDDTVKAWQHSHPSLVIDPPFHTPGQLNVADIATRGKVTSRVPQKWFFGYLIAIHI